MKLPCFICNGSGWAYKYSANICKKPDVFILIPCKDCKGEGLKEWKFNDEHESSGGTSKEIKKD